MKARGATDVLPPLDRIVSDLYGGFADDVSFDSVLEQLAVIFQAHLIGLRKENVRTRQARFSMIGEASENDLKRITTSYEKNWVGNNPWMERSVQGYLSDGFQYGEAVISDVELINSPYFRAVLRPLDIRHGFGICVAHDGGAHFSVIGVNRRRSVGQVSAAELDLIRDLRPHIVNIYTMHCRLVDAGAQIGTLRDSLNNITTGVLLLDEFGRILEANATANAILDADCGLSRGAERKLCASSPSGKDRLRAAIHGLLAKRLMETTTILLSHPRGEAANRVVLNMKRVSSFDFAGSSESARIMCFLSFLSQSNHDEIDQRTLRACFGLTSTEARVVQLLRQFHSAGAVALQLGVAENTVRTHIKSAFRKTETQRQSELIQVADHVLTATRFHVV